jgi:hypothetical protein
LGVFAETGLAGLTGEAGEFGVFADRGLAGLTGEFGEFGVFADRGLAGLTGEFAVFAVLAVFADVAGVTASLLVPAGGTVVTAGVGTADGVLVSAGTPVSAGTGTVSMRLVGDGVGESADAAPATTAPVRASAPSAPVTIQVLRGRVFIGVPPEVGAAGCRLLSHQPQGRG